MKRLPIHTVLPQVQTALRTACNAVLVAAPGAGKTTQVPLALLAEDWLAGRKIVMLEPRRLAARSAAQYMAILLGEQVGETIGYRVRQDTRVSAKTRIEVVTEGVLTRMLQQDPELADVGLIIFDEFHERNLQGDLGLALALEAQSVLREDLRLLVMSATLDAEPVAAMLGDAPIITSEGRMFPIETVYAERRVSERMEPAVCEAVLRALASEDGDVLVFLPGAGEIRRTAALLSNAISSGYGKVQIAPLYGGLSQGEQDRAIAQARDGERKVVLATSIAETSLTVEGIRVVVDSGWMRVPRFSPRTGMTRLETIRVSRASADQRRGRAGRVAAGVCYRLWTREEDQALVPRTAPEILAADLAPLVLELAVWGAQPAALSFLDAPPAPAVAQARELLSQLGALDAHGAVTAHGRELAALALHPRLAHMLRCAVPLGRTRLACELAALLAERDIARPAQGGAAGGAGASADVRERIAALRGERTALAVDAERVKRVRAEAAALERELRGAGLGIGTDIDIDIGTETNIGVSAAAMARGKAPAGGSASMAERSAPAAACSAPTAWRTAAPGVSSAAPATPLADELACGVLLGFAYPDRLAERRSDGRYVLHNGRGAALASVQPLSQAPYLAIAELDDQGADGRIQLAAPLDLLTIERYFTDQIVAEERIVWDTASEAVRARLRRRLGAIVISETPLAEPDPEAVLKALLEGIASIGLRCLPWSKQANQLRERMQFMHQHVGGQWPDVSEAALRSKLYEWLGPACYSMRKLSELNKLNLNQALEGLLRWEQRRELDEQVPTHIVVPSGSRIPVQYQDPAAPIIAVRLQEMFGLQNTPRIANGKVPLVLHLLSPAHRPVQVTRDLANFWRETYFEVRKDLKGRYPKHYWPDNPAAAVATHRVRPRET